MIKAKNETTNNFSLLFSVQEWHIFYFQRFSVAMSARTFMTVLCLLAITDCGQFLC